MWRSASESKPVHSRYSWLSQAWRTAKPIRIISAVSNWFRRRTLPELNSLNSIRLMWSTASEPGLIKTWARKACKSYFYRGQPKAGTGYKMLSVPFVFSMSRFQGPAFRYDKIFVIVTLLEAIEGIPDKDYNFGENENFHNFTRDYFVSENLRVDT